MRISKNPDPVAVVLKAATWIGRFHALCSTRVDTPGLAFLRRYDPDYYRGWAQRTLKIVEQTGLATPWLQTVCDRFDEVIEVLCEAPSTIIHGEYYPKNILFQDGLIYPVDWESTAIACGEIDLATLTEGWAQHDIEKLESAYLQARWPQGPSYDSSRCLLAARLYMQLRWLGDQQMSPEVSARHLDALREYAEAMELI